MQSGRTARPLLIAMVLWLAFMFMLGRPAAAETSFQGGPTAGPVDTDGDGRNDGVHLVQHVLVKNPDKRNPASITVTLEAFLFPPTKDPSLSWLGWVNFSKDQTTISLQPNSSCNCTFVVDLTAEPRGARGNYTAVLNLTTADTIIGPRSTTITVFLEPRGIGGSTSLPAAPDISLMMAMGVALVAVAAAAVWWLQRRPEKVEVKTGKGYFAETFQREAALRVVEPFIRRGYATLVISRVHPDEVRSMLPFEGVRPLWLVDYSDEAPKKVDAIPPSLEKLFARASAFLEGSLRTAVVVDGLEFLIDNSNFSSVMRFLRRLVDIVAQRDSLLLATVAPNALGPKERSNLERELTKVPV